MTARTFLLARPASLSALILCAAPAFAGVTVVAPSGGDYPTIGAAVAAVPDGEILLVRAGTYPAFTITSKSAHVIAEAGALVDVLDAVTVQNLAASQKVTLQGLHVTTSPFLTSSGLNLVNCAGSVRVQAVRVDTVLPGLGVLGLPSGVGVVGCADVALELCTAFGVSGAQGFPGFPTPPPTPALHVIASTVAIHGGAWVGGHGQSGLPSGGSTPPTNGVPGAAGIRIDANSAVFLQGAQSTGGNGGDGFDSDDCTFYSHPTNGGEGGAGLLLNGVSSVTVLAPILAGGAGGAGGTGTGGCGAIDGATGASVSGGSATTLPGTARALRVIDPAREGAAATLRFEGLPGDRVFLALAAGRQHAFEPILNGVLLVLPPFRRALLGTIDGSGVLDVALPVSELGAGVEGLLRQAQGIFLDTSGVRWTSGVSTLTLLDAGL